MKEKPALIFVFTAALLVRLLHYMEIHDVSFLIAHSTDLHQFMYYARKLWENSFFFQEHTYFNILYPLLLAMLHLGAGLSVKAIVFLQMVIDSVSAAAAAGITARAANQRAGILAGMLYALYGPLVFYAGLPLGETTALCLLLLSVLCLLRAVATRQLSSAFLSGFLFAAASLARPNIIISLPACMIVLWIAFRQNRPLLLKSCALLVMGCAIPLAPFSMHNYMTAQSLSPYTLHGGINLYIGNHAQALGVMQAVEGVSSMPGRQVLDSIERASQLSGRKLTDRQADAFWARRAFGFYREHPIRALKLLCRKAALFCNSYEFACNTDYYFTQRFSRVLRLPLCTFGVIFPFAVLNFLFVRKTSPGMCLLRYLFVLLSVSVILFYVSARLRIICAPFAIMLAASALEKIPGIIKKKQTKTIAAATAALGALVVLCYVPVTRFGFNINQTNAINYWNLGRYYFNNSEYAAAAKEFDRAAGLNPGNISYRVLLAQSYEKAGSLREALNEYKIIADMDPDNLEIIKKTGELYRSRKQWKQALAYYLHALRIAPRDHDVLNTVGGLFLSLGDLRRAEQYFLDTIRIRPDFPVPYYNLSVACFGLKKYEEAIAYLSKAKQLGIKSDKRFEQELISAWKKTRTGDQPD